MILKVQYEKNGHHEIRFILRLKWLLKFYSKQQAYERGKMIKII